MRKLLTARSAEEMALMKTPWKTFARDSRYTIFQSFDWNELAARIFSDKHPPFIVMAESDSGIAIIPACLDPANRRITLLGEELFDYRDVLHLGDPDVLRAAWHPIVDFAEERDFSFAFHGFRREGPSQRWCELPTSDFSSAPFIRANDPTPDHPHLSVNMRRLLRLGVTLHRYDGRNQEIPRRIYDRKSRETHSLFQGPLRVEMIVGMAQTAAEACKIFTLEHGGELVAALVTFRDKNWRRFYTTYYDHSWGKHSPGLTLLHEVVQQSLAQGLHCDFMTGDQPYKMRLATGSVPLYRVEASAGNLRESFSAVAQAG